MEVNDQLLLHNGQEAGLAQEPDWTTWSRQRPHAPADNRTQTAWPKYVTFTCKVIVT
jgi:hypothetical protein